MEGALPAVHLSQRGKIELAALTEELALSPDAHFISRLEGTQTRTWTFAGTKENRTYARAATSGGARVKFDALSVQAPAAALMPKKDSETTVQLTDEELATFAEGIKFASCIPSGLLCRTIVARMFAGFVEPVL